MTWTILIAKRVEKQLAKAPAKSRRLLLPALVETRRSPFTGHITRLSVPTGSATLVASDTMVVVPVFP